MVGPLPPIRADSQIKINNSCNCCNWPFMPKKKKQDPFKVKGHEKYRIVEKTRIIVKELMESK